MTSARLFPVCTFKRVFDVDPAPDVLTLAELVQCFRRFEKKPSLKTKIDRSLARIERASSAMREGRAIGGEAFAALARVREEALRRGDDAERALTEATERERAHARAEAKRDLRLWSPALYRPRTERGSEHVTHLSCLVLDYDRGVSIAAARETWGDFFHCLHTTWSHRESHPKFRVVLPLATMTPIADWDALWKWADERTEHAIDPALKGPAATFALPAVADEQWPRFATSHAGPLLDPRDLGLANGPEPDVVPRFEPGTPMRGDPEKEYLLHEDAELLYVYDDPE